MRKAVNKKEKIRKKNSIKSLKKILEKKNIRKEEIKKNMK